MRFIEKKKICQEFEDYVINNNLDKYLQDYLQEKSEKIHPWKKLDENKEGSEIKKKLTKYLYEEQKGLCIYCQQELYNDNKNLTNNAHIEHIKPKEKDKDKYPELTFEYHNLTVSCNGFDCSNYSKEKQFCGHKKSHQYKEDFFLNPLEIKEIEKYFVYSIEGNIKPAKNLNTQEKEKAEYMIKLLDLRNSILVDLRTTSYDAFLELNEDERKELLAAERKLFPGFYSMLQQFFF